MAQNKKTQRKFRKKSSKRNVCKRKTKVKRKMKGGNCYEVYDNDTKKYLNEAYVNYRSFIQNVYFTEPEISALQGQIEHAQSFGFADENEKKEFHKILKKMCNRHNKKYYPKYKKWCDEYFYLPHRKEARGIGGIFFDYKKNDFEKDFKFIREVGTTFELIFKKIIKKKLKKKWTLKDKEMQYIKRGRYTEFNLLYDRGTKFGLQTGGNVEGILMSLPPIAKWK